MSVENKENEQKKFNFLMFLLLLPILQLKKHNIISFTFLIISLVSYFECSKSLSKSSADRLHLETFASPLRHLFWGKYCKDDNEVDDVRLE